MEDALARPAAVALIEPRQVGKTTLAQQLGDNRRAVYLDTYPLPDGVEAVGLTGLIERLAALS